MRNMCETIRRPWYFIDVSVQKQSYMQGTISNTFISSFPFLIENEFNCFEYWNVLKQLYRRVIQIISMNIIQNWCTIDKLSNIKITENLSNDNIEINFRDMQNIDYRMEPKTTSLPSKRF